MNKITITAVVVVLVFAAILVGGIAPGYAQKGGTPTPSGPLPCDVTAMYARLTELEATGDELQDLDALRALSAEMRDFVATCDGLHFTGTGDSIVGPLDLDQGFYRVSVTTSTYAADAILVTLSGECEQTGNIWMFHMLRTEQTPVELQGLVQSNGCRAAIELSISGPWEMIVEKLE